MISIPYSFEPIDLATELVLFFLFEKKKKNKKLRVLPLFVFEYAFHSRDGDS